MNFLKHFYYLYLLFIQDLPRLRTLFFVGIGNFLPDTFFFSRIRVYLLILAGAKIKKPQTSIIRKGFFTENASNIELGEYIQINRNCLISGHGKTIIGNRSLLSYDVKLLTIGHTGKLHNVDVIHPIEIGENCMVYASSIINFNVKIGDNTVVGANSVVMGHLQENSTYAGNPARLIAKNIPEL
jgi:acetyltransferase-like isoleucine patch superfamily enzyme